MTSDPRKRRTLQVLARIAAVFSGVMVAITAFGMSTSGIPVTSAAPIDGGPATVIVPTDAPTGGGSNLTSGGSATPFSLKLPTNAACTGDSAAGNYRVQSYMVPESVAPSSLEFDSAGPKPSGSQFRQPLWDVGGSAYVNAQTANADAAGGPGPVINIPAFDLKIFTPAAGQVPAGTYNIGIACTRDPQFAPNPATATQLDKFWNPRLQVTASGSDQPGGITWTVLATPTTTTSTSSTSSTTSTTGSTTTTTPGGTTTTTVPCPTSTTTTVPATSTTSTTASTSTSTSSTSTTSTSTTSTTVPSSCPPAGTTVTRSVAAGGDITVSSTGWKSGSEVNAVLNSDPINLGKMTASSSGKIAGTLNVPATVPVGEHQLVLTGTDAANLARTVHAPVTVTAAGSGSTDTTAGPTGGTPSGTPVVGSSSVSNLPLTGGSLMSLLVWSALLLIFGRMAILLGRPPRVLHLPA